MKEVEATYLTALAPAKTFDCEKCHVRWLLFYAQGEEILVNLTAKPIGCGFTEYAQRKIAERFAN